MIRSMTGFGTAAGRVGASLVSVELRSVNHRFFNSSIKLPSSLARWEGEVRETLRRGISRGHVTISARVERDQLQGLAVDEARFADYVEQLRSLQQRHGLEDSLDVATILRLPEVVAAERAEQNAGSAEELCAVVDEALRALRSMREIEGKRLASFVLERVGLIENLLQCIAARAPERLASERERLRRSVRDLAGNVAVDEGRLAQELAILADKLDISEEIDRFRLHIAAFRATLESDGGEPVGKRLGFLLQEMLREANTAGSKAKDAALLHHVVSVKEELERIAEQVENLE